MKPEIERLIGGYATHNLSSEELETLYEAALADQEVFDAMMREEPVRELVDDAASRRQLLAAVQRKSSAWERFWARILTPGGLALAGGFAALAVGFVIYTEVFHKDETATQIAQQKAAPPVPEVRAPETQPATQPAAANPAAPPPPPPPTQPSNTQAEPEVRAEKKGAAPGAPKQEESRPAPAPAVVASKEQAQVSAVGGLGRSADARVSVAAPATEGAFDLFQRGMLVNSFASTPAPASRPAAPGGVTTYGASSEMARKSEARRDQAKPDSRGNLSASGPAQGGAFGVRYTVLRNGQPIDPNAAVSKSDELRVRLQANADGSLYVYSKQGDDWRELWKSNAIVRGKEYEVPVAGALKPGESLLVILDRTPTGIVRTRLPESEIERLFPSAALTLKEIRQGAGYAVTASPAADAAVLVRVNLPAAR